MTHTSPKKGECRALWTETEGNMKLYNPRSLFSATIGIAFLLLDGYILTIQFHPVMVAWVIFWLYLALVNLRSALLPPKTKEESEIRRAWRTSSTARHIQRMFTFSFLVMMIAMVVGRLFTTTYVVTMPIILVSFGFVALTWLLYLFLTPKG